MRQGGVHDLPAHQRTHHRSHRGADDGADECADQRAGEPFTAMVAATPTSTAYGTPGARISYRGAGASIGVGVNANTGASIGVGAGYAQL